MGRLFRYKNRRFFPLAIFAALTLAQAHAAETAAKPPPPPSLPVPRFASLKSNDVDMRVGPGTRYKVDWVYKRRELPVEILRDFDNWRLIRDPEGNKGWVHTATLTGRHSFITLTDDQMVRSDQSEASAGVARLEKGVIGEIRNCAANAAWCRVRVKGYEGYLPRTAIWGIEPNEAIGQ